MKTRYTVSAFTILIVILILIHPMNVDNDQAAVNGRRERIADEIVLLIKNAKFDDRLRTLWAEMDNDPELREMVAQKLKNELGPDDLQRVQDELAKQELRDARPGENPHGGRVNH